MNPTQTSAAWGARRGVPSPPNRYPTRPESAGSLSVSVSFPLPPPIGIILPSPVPSRRFQQQAGFRIRLRNRPAPVTSWVGTDRDEEVDETTHPVILRASPVRFDPPATGPPSDRYGSRGPRSRSLAGHCSEKRNSPYLHGSTTNGILREPPVHPPDLGLRG